MTYNVFDGMLNLAQSIKVMMYASRLSFCDHVLTPTPAKWPAAAGLLHG